MKTMNRTLFSALLFVGCILSCSVNAMDLDQSAVARNTVLDGDVQAKLRRVLSPQDFNNFNSNLDNFSVPYVLKSGATYYEATKGNLNAGSALVISPNGLLYVSYKLPNSSQIVYVTNDKFCNND